MKLSLFSVSYAGFWGQPRLDTLDFLDKAKELGYDTVMLGGKRPHLSPLDTDEATIEAVRARLKANGLECAVIAAYTDFGNVGAVEVPHVELQVAYVESLARIAAALGAKVVRVFTGYESAALTTEAAWARVVTGLRESCDRAAAHGVTVAVQNHHDIGVHTDAMLELIGDIDRPNCKLGYDTWSPALRGEDVYQAALKAAPHTVITTNADYVVLPRYKYQPPYTNYEPLSPGLSRAVPFGDGQIDFAAFFSGLIDGGFDGIASYEACSPIRGGASMDNLDRCCRQYLDWMRANVLDGG